MGKNLIQQARGKGSPTYASPSFRYAGDVKLKSGTWQATVVDLINSQGHSAPIAMIKYADGTDGLMISPEGLFVGTTVMTGQDVEVKIGNSLPLKNVPEGTFICNIESVPGDGGKFARTTGSFGRIVTKTSSKIIVLLPSKKSKEFHPECRATIGLVAGSGRLEKPFFKAGNMFHAKAAKNKKYPSIGGAVQNAVDHPFGNKRSSRKSKARPAPKNAPPGRNVGMIHPSRSGRKK
jgi:large subunit ribosomal protein L2